MSIPHLKKITLSVVNALPPNTTIWDTQLKGFCIRRQKSAAITYALKVRVNGAIRWATIGHHGQPDQGGVPWAPDTARKRAQQIIGNPTLAEKAAPPPAPVILTFDSVVAQFLAKHGPNLKPRSLVEYERLVRLYLLPAFAGRALSSITRADVGAAHRSWSKVPRSANFALTVLSRLMTWAKDEGLHSGDNPCTRVKRNKEPQRRRYLSMVELTRLGDALDQTEAEGLVTAPRHRRHPAAGVDRRPPLRDPHASMVVHRLRARPHLPARQQNGPEDHQPQRCRRAGAQGGHAPSRQPLRHPRQEH